MQGQWRRKIWTMGIGIAVLALGLAAGCGGQETPEGGGDGGWTFESDTGSLDAISPDTTSPDTTSPDTDDQVCQGDPFSSHSGCVSSCNSDYIQRPVCQDGKWVCPAGTVKEVSCPDDRCIGPRRSLECVSSCTQKEPQPGVCKNSQWVCPDGTFERSERCADRDCQVTTSNTNLDGVKIRFPGECRWSIEEVRQGIEIPYEVVVNKSVSGVVPSPTDAGRCDRPGESGLILGERIHGDGQNWCRCDVGLCMEPNYKARTLQPGTYRNTIKWEGHNWRGPSDTGNPKGELFPPGTYEVTVDAVGNRVAPGEGEANFELKSSLTIELQE